MFVGNTPLPLPLANDCHQILNPIYKNGRRLQARLVQNTNYVKEKLLKKNFPVIDSPSPIVALIPRNPKEADKLKKRLLSEGIHPPFIKYPGGPESGYFRFAISSEHTRAQLDALLRALTA